MIEKIEGEWTARAEGMRALGSGFEHLPTGKKLFEHWMSKLPRGEAAVLQALRNGDDLSQTGLAYASLQTYLTRLRAKKIINSSNKISPDLL
jgi:hypothetical protein